MQTELVPASAKLLGEKKSLKIREEFPLSHAYFTLSGKYIMQRIYNPLFLPAGLKGIHRQSRG